MINCSTGWIGRCLLIAVVAVLLPGLFTAANSAKAADPPNQPFDLVYSATGVKYRMLQDGEGMLNESEGTLLNFTLAGTDVVKAYLIWAGLGRDDNGVLFQRNGNAPQRITAPPEYTWNDDTFGAATWACCGNELSVYAADITDLDIVAIGQHDYTISDMDVTHLDGGETVVENWGFSLLVIYEDPELERTRDIYVKLGNDGLFARWDGLTGPNSDVQCLSYGASATERRATFRAVVGGVETEKRPNALWGRSGSEEYVDPDVEGGTWTQNAGLIHLPNNIIGIDGVGGVQLDGPLKNDSTPPDPTDEGSPFRDRAGDEWDEYERFNIPINPGDSWTCLQVESASQQNRPDLPAPVGGGSTDWIPASIGFMGFSAFIENLEADPLIDIIKYTNGQDANDPDGGDVPVIAPGDSVTWTYEVTNIGTVDIPEADITVTDSVEGTVTDIIDKGDGDTVLSPDESWLYQAVGTAVNLVDPPADPDLVLVENVCTQAGAVDPATTAYTNIGTVTIPSMTDDDPSSYCNPLDGDDPLIQIVKYTNGQDANDPDGGDVPVIAPGDSVTWTYEVTNIGTVDIPEADITVTDNVEGTVTDIIDKGDGDTVLSPDERWLFQALGAAINLENPPADPGLVLEENVCTQGGVISPASAAYTNVGTVTIPSMSDDDPSSYCSPPPTAIDEPNAPDRPDLDLRIFLPVLRQ